MSTVPRCANPDCADPYGGRVFPTCVRPGRVTGRRFGIDGVLCITCYGRFTRGSDLAAGRRRPDRPAPTPKGQPDPEAVRTIAQLRAESDARRAQSEPRRPCPANPRGGHRLIQEPGAGTFAPFVCADCGWRFFPPDQYATRKSA